MNKKLTVKTENGDLRYCILSADEDIAVQVGRFLHADGSAGLSTCLVGNELQINDYYHGELFAFFEIVSAEDTEEEISLQWTCIEQQ